MSVRDNLVDVFARSEYCLTFGVAHHWRPALVGGDELVSVQRHCDMTKIMTLPQQVDVT